MAVRKNSRRLGASNSSLATPAPVRGAGSVRIVSGKWKRSVVSVACAEGLRPTSERVRETVFDWLTHLFGTLEGCDALDMFAGSGALVGGWDFFTSNGGDYTTLIFQTVFCATAATIVSGAMAERTKFSAYCIYSMVISAVIYPISGHWIWGGGWLAQLGFLDFAGSRAVQMVGGVCAVIGAKILGPRIGKYGKDGKPKAILGHSLTLGALGVFILWFCWFGFNGCSTVSMTGDDAIVSAGSIFSRTSP